MFGNWQSHSDYQSSLLDVLNKLKSLHPTSLKKYQDGISKLYLLNLDVIKDLITPLFSHTGRPSGFQAQIFRSFVLMNHLHIYSITRWCRFELPNDPVLCAAIGVSSNFIPSANKGLLGDTSKLTVAADGTCVATGASSYGVKACECRKKGIYDCKCDRRFSDPNASWG
jgi:hypothetical protein